MLAIGVGGADAVDAMTGTPWELKVWASPKLHRNTELLFTGS
jgi:aconitase A